MGPAVVKNFEQQLRSAIGNYVRFGKMRRAVYKDDQFHDTPKVAVSGNVICKVFGRS